MSVIFLLSTLQLPEYVVDLTIKSDEKDSDGKLNLEVRVSCLYFSALFWSSFSPTKLSSLFFFSLSTAPRMCGLSDYQQVKIHNNLVFNDSRRIESCCNVWSMKGSVPSRIDPIEAGGVRTTIAMHCGFKIFKMAAKVEKFRRLYALFFNRYSSFLRSFFSIS